jgi:hypothetical protein
MSKHLSRKPRRNLKAAREMDGLARAKLMDRIHAWRELDNFIGVLPGLSAVTGLESLRKEWDS